MKNKKLKFLGSASAAAVALSLSPLVGAQTQSAAAGSYNQPAAESTQQTAASAFSPASSSSAQLSDANNASASGSLRIAAKDESKHTAQKLAGKKLRGQDGSELGTVKDFLVDPHSGEVRFAVVSTGGFMGAGDTLHLVPFRQLQQDEKGFTASLTKQQLDQAPAVNEEQFEENQVSLNSQDQQNATSGAMESNAGESAQLVRATKIKSHDVKANGAKIGSIEGIVIEPGSTDAVALLDPAKDIADTKQKFLVPLNRFTLSGQEHSDITTTLTRADFQAAGQYNATASASTASGSRSGVTGLNIQQGQNVADTGAGTAAASGSGETNSTTLANEQAQTASSSTQTTSPLSEDSSPNRSSMAANEQSSSATQATASSDQFGTAASPAGRSSGFAQNAPASSATSSSSSLSSTAAQDQQSAVATNDSSSSTSTTSVENGTNTPGLTPTGQTSADQNPQADPTLITAAQAIRHALDADPEIGHADVRVMPQDGKIVLQGQVASDSLKSQIEKKAQGAANGAEIDSQLKVQNQ